MRAPIDHLTSPWPPSPPRPSPTGSRRRSSASTASSSSVSTRYPPSRSSSTANRYSAASTRPPRVRPLLLPDDQSGRALRRRGEAAVGVLRGARQRRLFCARGGCEISHGPPGCSSSPTANVATSARPPAPTPPPTSSPATSRGPQQTRSRSTPTSAEIGLSRSSQACRLHGAGIFCLVRTSNAGASDVQELTLSDGRRVWQHVAALVGEWGAELTGRARVVERRRSRRRNRSTRGRRGPSCCRGRPAAAGRRRAGCHRRDVARAFTSGPASALVTVSRSVIFAYRGSTEDWRGAAGAEAARLRADVWSVSGW